MARKTVDITIAEEGRDQGKVFVITEADAVATERWALRALFLAAQAGADIKNVNAGLAGVAVMGIQAVLGMKFAEVEPLLDEMLSTISFRPDARSHDIAKATFTRALMPRIDIEEVATLIKLREEVVTLHLGFSIADILSRLKTED